MPEEINRIVTDALSDFLFVTEESAAENLRREGIPEMRIHWVGNTMVDTLLRHRKKAERSVSLRPSVQREPRGTATLHRPSN
jgi:UDP-N-acetylglucosamine 2-epimerase (non-hydrolysing)